MCFRLCAASVRVGKKWSLARALEKLDAIIPLLAGREYLGVALCGVCRAALLFKSGQRRKREPERLQRRRRRRRQNNNQSSANLNVVDHQFSTYCLLIVQSTRVTSAGPLTNIGGPHWCSRAHHPHAIASHGIY